MANISVTIDTKGLENLLDQFGIEAQHAAIRGLGVIADEVIRLSSFEVPHDEGMLQASATVQREGDYVLAGYNKAYAARLHEHPEYNFQKGRKAKYLEDPIKNNLEVLNQFYGGYIKNELNLR